MRAADDDRHVHFFLMARRAPGLLDLRCVGGDADQVRLEFLDEVLMGWSSMSASKTRDRVATAFRDRAQVGQPQVGSGAGVDRKSETRVDQGDADTSGKGTYPATRSSGPQG